MATENIEISDIYWVMDALQSIDVGLVVLDRDYHIQAWNSFMANHSGLRSDQVIDHSIFQLFPDIPQDWFKRKAESVVQLKSRAFTTWEQRPFLFKFKNARPITGSTDFMYQNITFMPLMALDGSVQQVGIIIYDVSEIASGKTDLLAANVQLEQLSRIDLLTQLNNRNYWESCLAIEFARTLRTRHPCTLIMFDIDHFKKVNDAYGHPAGDDVIRATSQALRSAIRETDIAGRYGGEEFGVILINSTADSCHVVSERLRTTIEAMTVKHAEHSIRYTISLGIADISADMKDYKDWLTAADAGLYQSKHAGRNCTTIYRPPSIQTSPDL